MHHWFTGGGGGAFGSAGGDAFGSGGLGVNLGGCGGIERFTSPILYILIPFHTGCPVISSVFPFGYLIVLVYFIGAACTYTSNWSDIICGIIDLAIFIYTVVPYANNI